MRTTLLALSMAAACTACAHPTQAPTAEPRVVPATAGSSGAQANPGPRAVAATPAFRVVPQGMVGVALVGADRAPSETVEVDELQAKIEAAHAEAERVGRSSEGSPGIFFYGFDRDRLVYFRGRTHWRCHGLGCWDYVAERLYVVRRGHGVEAALGVDKQIDLYERADGVKGGMTPAQVRASYGEPDRVEPLQYVGSERWYYRDKTVLFLGGEVAGVEAPAK